MTFSSNSSSEAKVRIKTVQEDDCNDIWQWRNDPITKANSQNTQSVPYNEHCDWFASVLADTNQFLMVGMSIDPALAKNPRKIGMVRFSIEPQYSSETKTRQATDGLKKAVVSININPEFRGKGLSVELLKGAIKHFRKEISSGSSPPLDSLEFIEATIKECNIASIKCFEKVGFKIALTAEQQNSKGSQRPRQQLFLLPFA